MTTCQVDYIEDLTMESREEKDRLTALHINIARQLYGHRFDNKGFKKQIFTFANNKLFVPGTAVFYDEAVKLIKDINAFAGFEAVTLVQDEINPNRHYVNLDVRSDSVGTPVTMESMLPFYKKYFGDSAIVQMSEEFEDVVPTHESMFQEIADTIRRKAAIYLNAQDKSGDTNRKAKTKRDLRVLLASLNDRSTFGLIESVSKYIAMTNKNLIHMNRRIANITDKIKNLSSIPEVRATQLTEIADFTRHTSYYYHLFDVLDDFATELGKLGVNGRAIDNYERDLLENSLREFLVGESIPEDKILEFLNKVPALLQNSGELFTEIKDIYRSVLPDVNLFTLAKADELQEGLKNILNANMKPEGSLQQQLINSLNDLRAIKSNLKDLHYNTITEVYYPTFESSFADVNDKMSTDGKQKLDDKWKLDKESFKALLKIGDEDISAWSRYGSAMINVSDTVAVTIANYFKDVMIDIDRQNKTDVGDFQDFLYKNKKNIDDLAEHDVNFVHENLLIETVKEVDDSYIPAEDEGIVSVLIFGERKKFSARRTRNYLNEYNNIAFNNQKKVFQASVDDATADFVNQLLEDKYSLIGLRDNVDPTLRYFYDMLYAQTDEGEVFITNNMGRFYSSNPTLNEFKAKIKGMLTASFYNNRIINKTEVEVNSILEDNGVFIGDTPTNLNSDNNYTVKKHILANTYWQKYREYARGEFEGSTLKDRFHWSPNTVFGKRNGEVKQVLVKYTDYTYGYVELAKTSAGVVLSNPEEKEIMEFATFSGEYNTLHANYHIANGGFGLESKRKWEWKEDGGFNKQYFDKVIQYYKASNNNFGPIHLQFREVPQVDKRVNSTKFDDLKRLRDKVTGGQAANVIYEEAKSYLYKENGSPTNETIKYTDDDGIEQEIPVYVSNERQYVNGQKIRDVPARFLKTVPLKELETNIYKSLMLYKVSSNVFRGLKNNESQALLLQTVLEGDSSIGIDPRKMKVKRDGQYMRVPGGELKYADTTRSKDLMLSFINDYVFHQQDADVNLLGLSGKKIASVLGGYTAFASLAWNVSTMVPNHLISLHNTRAVAKGNQWFNQDDWNQAIKDYAINMGGFLQDFKSQGFVQEKSVLTQMLIRFNAIQGEFLSPKGILETKGIADKLADSALFWTQEMVEHANQTQSMIMLMRGYKMPTEADPDRNLYTAIMEVNKDRRDGQPLQMPEDFTYDKEKEFQKRLQGVNRQIHGNYSQLDKNDLQRNVFTNLAMTFRKYIYDGFRSRFMEERWDQELRDEQEGYFRTYLKALNKDFASTAKTQGLAVAMKSKGLKALGTTFLKTSLGGWDAATFRLLSKNNESVKQFLYGEDPTERQAFAAIRATYEIGNVVRAMLLVAFVEWLMSDLDEDDEWSKRFLGYIDVYARKLEGDIGFFTSFTNAATGTPAGPTLDQLWRLIKNPFAATRAIDNTSGIFMQLIDFDAMNEEGDFEFSWGAFDQYEKSGNGYEKGDYKIARKFQKSIFSPYWQVIKFMDYQQQLNYINMVFKSGN